DLAAPLPARAKHEFAANHERFLVRKRHTLARAQGSERGLQSRGADDCIHHHVHVRTRRCFDQAFGTGSPRAIRVAAWRDDPDIPRIGRLRLFAKQRGVAERGQRNDAELIRVPRDHPERGRAYRASRAEYRDPARSHTGAGMSIARNSSTATGRTNSRLSKRSSTPPCPGISVELSLMPASRFISDSARSPTCATMLIVTAKRTVASGRIASCARGCKT